MGWVIGQCEIIRRLSPGTAKCLLGHREEQGSSKLVALKKVDVAAERFVALQRHAWQLMDIGHPNLARIYDCESSSEGVFWVTEFLTGASLVELRGACKKAGKSVPLGIVFACVHDAALALGELHRRGLAHGDVSDANLLVTFAGSARVLNPGVLNCLEQLSPDPRADVFKLADLLYRCLTGQGASKVSRRPRASTTQSSPQSISCSCRPWVPSAVGASPTPPSLPKRSSRRPASTSGRPRSAPSSSAACSSAASSESRC